MKFADSTIVWACSQSNDDEIDASTDFGADNLLVNVEYRPGEDGGERSVFGLSFASKAEMRAFAKWLLLVADMAGDTRRCEEPRSKPIKNPFYLDPSYFP